MGVITTCHGDTGASQSGSVCNAQCLAHGRCSVNSKSIAAVVIIIYPKWVKPLVFHPLMQGRVVMTKGCWWRAQEVLPTWSHRVLGEAWLLAVRMCRGRVPHVPPTDPTSLSQTCKASAHGGHQPMDGAFSYAPCPRDQGHPW